MTTDTERRDGVVRSSKATHVKHLLPHGRRVGRALVGQQPFGDGAAGGDLVIFVKRAEKEKGALECRKSASCADRGGRVGLQGSAPPGDLQVQLHRPEVIDVHGQRLGKRAEEVQHFAGHAPHHHVIGQALQLRHLTRKRRKAMFLFETEET